jgi:mannose-1-phosphate guanylyltransferase/phosphomannomutase
MFALAKTLELMARLDVKLSEVFKAVPKINFLHSTVPCPWEFKGVVMRKASEEAMGKNAIFLDGVKIYFDDSWVLIFPDQYKSMIHLYAEAKTEDQVYSLMENYKKKIESWIKTL